MRSEISHLKNFHCTCKVRPVGNPLVKKETAKVIFVIGIVSKDGKNLLPGGLTRTAVIDYVHNTPRADIIGKAWAKVKPTCYPTKLSFIMEKFDYISQPADGVNLIMMCHAKLKEEITDE